MSKRIPRPFIDELLAKTDIVSVIERYLSLKKTGSNYSALCPFHNEKNASFSVSPAKQFFYCFGCGASGNAISFVMDYERLGFLDAVEQLASQAGMQIPTTEHHSNPDFQAILELLSKAQQFYQEQLTRHPAGQTAQQYLSKRGLSSNTIKQFGIGFAPPGWDNLLKITPQQQQRLLLKAGLVIENENQRRYDRFRNRILFPIRDRRGRVIGFGGRVLDDSTPKYLNSPETPVFHKGQELYGLYEARQYAPNLKQVVVVEGYMDVIALANQGIHYAVATLGTAITSNHLRKLMRSTPKIIFSFDGDSAGSKAAWKALEIAFPQLNEKTDIAFAFMPKGEDPDSYIQQHGQTQFEQLLNQAMPLTEFFLDHLSEQVNLETLAGRAKLISLAMPYLQQINSVIIKELLLEALAELTRTSSDKLEQWSGGNKPSPIEPQKTRKSASSHPGTQTPVRLAVSLILQHPKTASQITTKLQQGKIRGLNLLNQLLDLTRSAPHITTGTILEHWRDQPEFPYLAKLAGMELLTPESGVLAELEDTLKHINKVIQEQKIDELYNKMRQGILTAEEKKVLQTLLNEKNSGF